MNKIDLKELAFRLNLSIATVSKALGDSYEIKEETKQRVRELARQLDYKPNLFASNLRKQKSQTIGVVIPEIASNFFSLVLDGIQVVAQKKGYHVLTYITHENYSNEASIFKHLENGRVDGVIVSLCSETQSIEHISTLKDRGKEIVFFDRVSHLSDCPTVTTDDYASGFNATEHLIQNNCKRIAYLSISDNISINQKRMQGYLDALKRNDVNVDEKLIIPCTTETDKHHQIIKKLLLRKRAPDGIFASVENLAIATYNVCRDLNIRIPQQVKVISFSNLRTASLLKPSLSTIAQPAFEMGKEACSLLFRRIEKKSIPNKTEHLVLKSTLVIRESTLEKRSGAARIRR